MTSLESLSYRVRHSLLAQMVGVYLAFVLVVLGAGLVVNAEMEQQVRGQVQSYDLALAQEIALETSTTLQGAEASLVKLSQVDAVRAGNPGAMVEDFQAFQAARNDVDHVYWIDPVGDLRLSVPSEGITMGREFEPPDVIQRALRASAPVREVGFAHDAGNLPGVIIAEPVLSSGTLLGIVAASFSLEELSTPLDTVVQAQRQQGKSLQISILDDQGRLVGTPQQNRILQTVVDELPGADQALRGRIATRLGPSPSGQDWLFSAVPVPEAGWAVVVQRPASEALAVAASFRAWLLFAALLFGVGVVLFWLVLVRRVIRPLHVLATVHTIPSAPDADPRATTLTHRLDEVGDLARSLDRLEHDVALQLAELQTLLQTSNAVVSSLDPRLVADTIIHEVGRLVDVQAATVLVPDDEGILHVLASDGRSDHYIRTHHVSHDEPHSPAAQALRENQPVQLLATEADADPTRRTFPAKAYAEGFRSLLAIPIISRHAGGVVLLVHRAQPVAFTSDEVSLLLVFANHATLAWEHAVLYERSDERLREVAAENEHLYHDAEQEKRTLAAIMGSMRDGLILMSADGIVLYANVGASRLLAASSTALEGRSFAQVQAELRAMAERPDEYDRERASAAAEEGAEWLLELRSERVASARKRVLRLRLFDVQDAAGQAIGRGLLLRDVTREREIDEMKTALLDAVAHELRTPLAVIKGHTSTLLQDDVVWSADDQRHSLRLVNAEADHLADLLSNLLDLTRVEAGLLPLHLVPWHLDDLIASVLQRLGEQRTRVSVELPVGLPPVTVDRARIEVVLRNLIANALVYGGKRVVLRAEAREGMVTVAVADDGPGIDREDLPRMFERFHRAKRGAEQRAGGSGLGLAICKAFVEAHGGSISAQSGSTGTIIEFTLPAAEAAVVSEESAAAPA